MVSDTGKILLQLPYDRSISDPNLSWDGHFHYFTKDSIDGYFPQVVSVWAGLDRDRTTFLSRAMEGIHHSDIATTFCIGAACAIDSDRCVLIFVVIRFLKR